MSSKAKACRRGHKIVGDNAWQHHGYATCRTCSRERQRQRRAVRRSEAGTLLCECGCGTVIPAVDSNGRPTRFAVGHWNKGKANYWLFEPDSKNPSTGHAMARRLYPADRCAIDRIGGCSGPVGRHHRDKDPSNNEPSNVVPLCASHHGLVERGRINLAAPVMPEFYVSRCGKRRYEWSAAYKAWLRARATRELVNA